MVLQGKEVKILDDERNNGEASTCKLFKGSFKIFYLQPEERTICDEGRKKLLTSIIKIFQSLIQDDPGIHLEAGTIVDERKVFAVQYLQNS